MVGENVITSLYTNGYTADINNGGDFESITVNSI